MKLNYHVAQLCVFMLVASCCHCRCAFSTVPTVGSFNSGSNKQWQLLSAVCVERLPIITQEMNEREREMLTLMKQVELEYSHLSDHELRHAEDM
jgi:39S mitochondrial ribosomal protein L46